jgi:hypothetical protein
MASSPDESSDYDAGIRSPLGDTLTLQNTRRPDAGSGTDGEHTEDLFLNIAQDTTPQRDDLDGVTTRTERRRVSLRVDCLSDIVSGIVLPIHLLVKSLRQIAY